MIQDNLTGNSKGYGFCEFTNQENALNAKEKLDQREFMGRRLNIIANENKKML